MQPIIYTPIYAGSTDEGEKIALYKDGESRLHIKVNDGDLIALGPDVSWSMWSDFNEAMATVHHLILSSPQWSGHAKGFRLDLIKLEPIRV